MSGDPSMGTDGLYHVAQAYLQDLDHRCHGGKQLLLPHARLLPCLGYISD